MGAIFLGSGTYDQSADLKINFLRKIIRISDMFYFTSCVVYIIISISFNKIITVSFINNKVVQKAFLKSLRTTSPLSLFHFTILLPSVF